MPPSIAPRPQVRRPGAPVRIQRCRHFANFEPHQAGFDDHLAGEFHARSFQSKLHDRVPAKCTDAAVKVTNGDAEEYSAESAQDRIPKIPMQAAALRRA